MFIWMEVIPMFKEGEFVLFLFVAGLILWTVGGLCFGLWINYLIQKKQGKR